MSIAPSVYFGTESRDVPQYAVIGSTMGDRVRTIGLDLNTTSTAAMVGRQGVGKSYSLGVILESFTTQIPNINHLPRPGCGVVFHYSRQRFYKPEWASMRFANDSKADIGILRDRYRAVPIGATEVVIVTPPDLVAACQAEFPDLRVEPLYLHESELTVDSWLNLMGGAETSSLEMQVLLDLMRQQRAKLSVKGLMEAVEAHEYLSKDQKFLLRMRLGLADRFVSSTKRLNDLFKPGRIVVIDLRDEFLDEATAFRLGLCVLSVFQNAVDERGERYPKLLCFDEAHEYARDPFLIEAMVRIVRLMRHLGMTILFASQDPPSLPEKVLELSSLILMLGMETPKWVHYLAECKTQIAKVVPDELITLRPGQCFAWARQSSDPAYVSKPQMIQIRPRATKHGGTTKTAVA